MARRLNTKFIIILIVFLVGVGTALGTTWFIAKRSNAVSALRDADLAMKAGEYEQAEKLYTKVLRHPDYSGNVDIMLKISDAHLQVLVDEVRDSGIHIQFATGWLNKAINAAPYDERAMQRLMDMLIRRGHGLYDHRVFDEMFAETQSVLDKYPEVPVAIKYRGIAQVNRMAFASTNLTPEHRQDAAKDLRFALEQDPDDRLAIAHFAWWHALEAQITGGLGGDEEKAQEFRDEALRITGDALLQQPNDLARLVDHAKTLSRLDRMKDFDSHGETLLQQLETQPNDSEDVIEAVGVIMAVDFAVRDEGKEDIDTAFYDRIVGIVQAARERHPDSPALKVLQGQVYAGLSKYPEAMEAFNAAWNSRVKADPMDFLYRRRMVGTGGLRYLTLQMSSIEEMTDPVERQAGLNEVEAALVKLKAEFGDLPTIGELEGRISQAQGNFVRASIEYAQIKEETSGRDISTRLRSAETNLRLNQWGAAAEDYENVLRFFPKRTDVRVQLARLYLRGQMLGRAINHIEELEKLEEEEDERIDELRLELLVRQENFAAADAMRKEIDLAEKPRITSVIAGLYDRADRKDEAVEMLESAFDKDMTGLRVLSHLVALTEEQSQQQVYIDRSRAAGADEEALDQIQQFVQGDLDEGSGEKGFDEKSEVEEGLGAELIKEYLAKAKAGDRQGAEAGLAEIQDESSLYNFVIWQIFQAAGMQRDWTTCEAMVDRAREANDGLGADYAGGQFYLGTLNINRGQPEQAVIDLRAGLEQRRVYAGGWRMLGDALVEIQEFDGAVNAYETALSQQPDNVRALIALAGVHEIRGEKDIALAMFHRAQKYSPDNFRIKHAYLNLEVQYGDKEKALAERQEIAAEDPENQMNRRALVLALKEMGRLNEAKELLKGLVEEEGNSIANCMLSGRLAEASEGPEAAADILMSYLKEKGDEVTEDEYLTIVDGLSFLGKHEESINVLRQAMAIEDPKTRHVTRKLAAYLIDSEEGLEEAAALYKKLTEADPSDRQTAYAYTDLLMKSGNMNEAEANVKRLVSDHGYEVGSLLLSAQLAGLRGDFRKSMSFLDQAIEKAPRRAMLYLLKAEIISNDPRRQGDALANLDRALELQPKFSRAQLLKARIYAVRGEFSASIQEYEAMLRYDPKQAEVRRDLASLYGRTNRERELEIHLAESAKLFPKSAEWPRRQAYMKRRDGNYDEALERLKIAFELEPERTLLFELVSLQLLANRPHDALDALQDQEDLAEESPRLQALRGRALQVTQKREDAASVFRAALKKTEDLNEFMATRDQIVMAIDVRAAVDLITETFGTSPPIWVSLGVSDLERLVNNFEGAIARLAPLESTIDNASPYERLYYYETYSLALFQGEHSDEAERTYRRLLEITPNNPRALNNLSYLLSLSEGKLTEAIELAERAREMRPQDPMILDTLGWALFRAQEYSRAREALESSVRSEKLAVNCLHLAEVLIVEGMLERAKDLLKTAKKLAERDRDDEMVNRVKEVMQQLTE